MRRRPIHHLTRQQGSALLFALIALVSMTLAALALVRSIDTSTLILGNVGFKQNATGSAEQASRQAITWLSTATTLTANDTSNGYYATTDDNLDATGFQSTSSSRALINWDNDNCAYAGNGTYASCTVTPKSLSTINGYSAQYVILRMCSATTSGLCSQPMSTSASTDGSRGSLDYSYPGGPSVSSAYYYRIVVRIKGARDTASFTETIVQR